MFHRSVLEKQGHKSVILNDFTMAELRHPTLLARYDSKHVLTPAFLLIFFPRVFHSWGEILKSENEILRVKVLRHISQRDLCR